MYGYETFHEKIMLELINAARAGEVRQAYIFEGADGLGLDASARLFAAALTCGGDGAPCGECRSCRLAASGTNPDIITLSPTKKSIGADEVRKISADAYIKPFTGKRKVYITEKANLMTVQAQNAFLKTLEEPPEFAVFILITPDADALLQTVRSRCVKIRFPRISDGAVREYVEKKLPDCENIDFAVRYAEGIPENAVAVLTDESFSAFRADAFDALAKLLSPRKIDAYSAVEFMEKNKDRAQTALELWSGFVRDIMLVQEQCDALLVNSDFLPRITRAANRIDESRIIRVQQRLTAALKMHKRYVNLRALTLKLAFGE